MINSVGSKIKVLRKEKKLTQAQLCGDKINRCVLSLIENNKMQPSISQLNHFCKILDVPVTHFTSDIDYNKTIESIGIDDNSDLAKAFIFKENEYITKLYEHDSVQFNTIENINKYYYLGMSYYNLSIYKESILPLKKYINSFSKKPKSYQKLNISKYATALNTLSKIYMQRSNYTKAEEYLIKAYNFLTGHQESNSLIYCIVINNLAYVYNKTGQYKKTFTIINDFFNTHDNLSYRILAPQLHKAMNVACYNLGNYYEAIEHVEKSILLCTYENHYHELGRSYIDYINALRYSYRFPEATEIVEKCKKDFYDIKVLYRKFCMQELILYFNMRDYIKASKLLANIQFNSLQEMGKNNFSFISGHISFINNEYEKALKSLNKCEKYFLKNMYHYDLALVYDDLFAITGDKLYLDKKKASLSHDAIRRNVLIDAL